MSLPRNRYSQQIVMAIQQVNGGADAKVVLRQMLVDSLTDQQRLALDFIAADAPMSPTRLGFCLGVSANHAGVILYRLWDYGLLTRHREDGDVTNSHYVYELAS